MKKPSFSQRFRYWFDKVMARGTGALLTLLAVATALVILVDAAVVLFLNVGPGGEDSPGLSEILWGNTIRTLGADDVAEQSAWAFRFAMLFITFAGVFIVANLIGIVSGAFDEKVAQLRKGRSQVLEKGHTVILGWNPKVPAIISGLAEAKASERRPAVVVLAPRDKVEMEDEIKDKVPNLGRLNIVCRSGDPLDQDDLLITNPYEARSIIILSADQGDDPDARAIKTALALTRHHERDGRPIHIVGQIRRPENLEVAELVGGKEATWILATEKIGQITAQTSRQPGLSAVYVELFGFEGAEIYFTTHPTLYGESYAEIQHQFPESTVLGVVKGQEIVLNPPASHTYMEGEQIIVIAQDDSSIKLGPGNPVDPSVISKAKPPAPKPEKTLILGANSALPHILEELNAYAAKGSTVKVVSDHKVPELPKYSNTAVTVVKGKTTSRRELEALKPTQFDHVIVAAYADHMGVQEADTATLITLLHLRDITDKAKKHVNVVSEMLDERNRKLAEVCQIDDFIVSDHLVSLMMSQLSENPMLSDLFADLLSAEGQEIYIRPASWYVQTEVEVDFHTILAAASKRKETAIGYVKAAPDGRPQSVDLAPVKAIKRAYSDHDHIVVIAED